MEGIFSMGGSLQGGIDVLPLELLVALFTSYLTASPEGGSSHARTTLALVSKRWYSVCYSTPSLWSRIHDEDAGPPNALALSQSQQHPLDVFLDMSDDMEPTKKAVREGFKQTCAHLYRWRTAAIEVGKDEDLASLANPGVPLLESIILKKGFRDSRLGRVDLFGGEAPKLRHLRLSRVVIPWGSNVLSGLRGLVLDTIERPNVISLFDIISILVRSPQLRTLTLHCLRVPSLPAPVPTPVQLPYLQELELTGFDPTVCGYLLQSIKAPRCQRLHLHVYPVDHVESWDPLLVIPYITPFIPHESLEDLHLSLAESSVQLESGQRCMDGALDIWLLGTPAVEAVRALAAALAPPFLTAEIEVVLDNGIPSEIEDLLDVADLLHVTNLAILWIQPDRVLQYLSEPQSGRHWSL